MNASVEPTASVIEIFRDTADDVQDRWVRISIDGSPEEILRYGETRRWKVAPGSHRIKAHNTLSKDAVEVTTAPGETVRVRCHNRVAKGGALMMLTTGFAFITVKLELTPSKGCD